MEVVKTLLWHPKQNSERVNIPLGQQMTKIVIMVVNRMRGHIDRSMRGMIGILYSIKSIHIAWVNLKWD